MEAAGGDQTPARLLDAAEALFARKGYAATSVRDITQAAGCNVASVNYADRGGVEACSARSDRGGGRRGGGERRPRVVAAGFF
ncbi:MAG: TetR family transcriptional regulator [Planctomycetota bacterium]